MHTNTAKATLTGEALAVESASCLHFPTSPMSEPFPGADITARRDEKSAKTKNVIYVVVRKSWFDILKSIAILALVALFVFSFAGGVINGLNDPGSDREYFDSAMNSIDAPSFGSGTTSVGLIDLNGEILSQDDSPSFGLSQAEVITPLLVRKRLSEMRDIDGIAAVVLRISTPGGTVAASDEISHIIREFGRSKPVYVYTNELLASGGYYIAASAKKIYAAPQAEVGSIGVIYQIPNMVNLAQYKLGITMEVYKSGPYKDLNNPFRYRTAIEKRLIQAQVKQAFDAFLYAIQSGRGMTKERPLATGQVWSGNDAAANGLIDAVAYEDQLGQFIKTDLQLPGNIIFIRSKEQRSLIDEVLYPLSQVKAGPTIDVEKFVPHAPAGAYYLYYN